MRDPRVTLFAETGLLRLKFRALSGDTPLTPIELESVLKTPAQDKLSVSAKVLVFLSYQEKLLAGSWRFATYFGRDTLMALLVFARKKFCAAFFCSALSS